MNRPSYTIRPEWCPGLAWGDASEWSPAPSDEEAAVFTVVNERGHTVDILATRREAQSVIKLLEMAANGDLTPSGHPKLRPISCLFLLLLWSPFLFAITANGERLGLLAWVMIAGWLIVAYRIWRAMCPPGGRL